MEQDNNEREYLSSVKNALRILNSFSMQEPVKRVSDIAQEFGLSKSTVSRLMQIMDRFGFVIRDEDSRSYRLGYSLLRLSNVLQETVSLRTEALPLLRQLVAQTDHSAHLVVLHGTEVTYLATVQCNHPVRIFSPEGIRNPAYCTSSGKIILSYQKDDIVDRVIQSGMNQFTRYTITDPDEFKQHLQVIKEQGYVTSFEEFIEGVVTIGAPIRDHSGRVIAAVTIVGPIQRLHFHNVQIYIKKLVETAEQISARMGYQPDERS